MRHRAELFWASVAEGTKKRYLAALEEFLAFADTLAYELNSITALDTCLNDFIMTALLMTRLRAKGNSAPTQNARCSWFCQRSQAHCTRPNGLSAVGTG